MCNQFVNTATEYLSTLKGLLVPFPHGTDEGDVGGLAVQHRLVGVDPQAGHLGQHVNHLHSPHVLNHKSTWHVENIVEHQKKMFIFFQFDEKKY